MTRYLIAALLLLTFTTPAHAGPLAALVPVVVGMIKASALVKLAITLVATVAITMLSRAMQKKPRPSGIAIEHTLTGGVVSRTIPVGLYCTAGSMVCPPMSHGSSGDIPNAYLTQVIAIGDVPVDGLNILFINGERVAFSGAATEYGTPIGGKYAGHGWIKFYDGTQTTADAMLVSKYGSYMGGARSWPSSHVGVGVSYAILTWKFNNEIFKGEPTVKFEVRGKRMYDIRKDSTAGGSGAHRWGQESTYEVSYNPMVITYNILRGIMFPDGTKWGGECEASDLPTANWVAAMNVCDETVTTSSGSEPRYRCGFEIKVAEDEPADVIEELLKACSGSISEIGGIYKSRAGGPALPTVFVTDDDFLVSREQDYDPFPALTDSHNGIFATFPHPQEEWNVHDAPSIISDTYLEADGGVEIFANVQLPAVPFPVQVQRLMRAWLDDDRRWRRHTASLGPYGFTLEPMDTISWTSARNGYVNKVFELDSIDTNLMTLVTMTALREVDPNDYNWTSAQQLPDPTTPGQWELPPAQAVPGFAVEAYAIKDAANGNRRPAIRALWTASAATDATALKIEVRLQATQVIVADITVSRVDAGQTIIAEGILPGQIYQVRARYQANRATTWSSWLSVTAQTILLGAADVSGLSQLAIDTANALEAIDDIEIEIGDILSDIGDVQGNVATLTNNIGVSRANPERYVTGDEKHFTVSAGMAIVGSPESLVPVLANVDLPGFGKAYQHTVTGTGYRDFGIRDVLPIAANKTYSFEAEFDVTAVGANARLQLTVRTLNEAFASVGTTGLMDVAVTATGTVILTGKIAATASSGVSAWVAGATLRPFVRLLHTSGSASTTVRMKRFRVRDTSEVQPLSASVTQQASAISTLEGDLANVTVQLKAGGGNLLENSSFPNGNFAPWTTAVLTGMTTSFGVNQPNSDWYPPGEYVLMQHQPDAGTVGYSQWQMVTTIEANKWYEFSVYGAVHRCNGSIYIQWLDASNVSISAPQSALVTPGAASNGGTQLVNYARMVVKGKAPANAARARLIVRKLPTLAGNTDSYMWFLRPQLVETLEHTASPIAYSPSNGQAVVTQIASAYVTLDSNYASLSSTVGGHGVTISDHTSALSTHNGNITTLFGRRAMLVDVNGYTIGWEMNNNGTTGVMKFRTNALTIEPPGGGPGITFAGNIIKTDNGTFMKVTGIGFGSSGQFVEWFGPTQANLANCTEANAIFYLKNNGDAYFGGSLSAGVLKNAATSTQVSPTATVETGSFTSNGDPRVITMSYSYRNNRNYSVGPTGVSGTPTATISLQRGSGASWTTLTTQTFTGNTQTTPGGGGDPGLALITISGSATFTDSTPGTSFNYRLVITSRVMPTITGTQSGGGSEIQTLSIISIEN